MSARSSCHDAMDSFQRTTVHKFHCSETFTRERNDQATHTLILTALISHRDLVIVDITAGKDKLKRTSLLHGLGSKKNSNGISVSCAMHVL